MRISSLLTLCILSVSTVHGKFGADKSVCDIGKYVKRASVDTGPKKPTLPPQWTVRIEGNILEHNYTQDILEYYDDINNRGAVVQYISGIKSKMIFQYNLNELITLQYDASGKPPRCKVDDLAKSAAKSVFGLTTKSDGTEHIFSANQALRFGGKIPEVYIGRDTARDSVIVDAWESCNYFDTLDSTLHMVWYFSANNTWTTAINQVVPVQLSIDGIVHVNASYSYPIEGEYVFTDFRPVQFAGPEEAFVIPPKTNCPNWVSARQPPKIANSFSFSAEIVAENVSAMLVDFIEEYYDGTHKLARFDRSVGPSTSDTRKMMTEVLDYATGIMYNIDPGSGTCFVSTINADSMGVAEGGKNLYRMASPVELMHMNNMTRTYIGKRKARGFTCDVFSGTRLHDQPGFSLPTLYEWYYASREWMENTGDLLQSNQLVMFQLSSDIYTFTYNVFDYKEEQQNIWETDVTSCYNYTQRELVSVTFHGTAKDNVVADVDGFRYAVVTSAANLAHISPLRVTELQVDYSGKNIAVSFYVLDSPNIPVKVKVSSPVVSLSDAVSKLKGLISEGAFVVMLPNFVPIYSIKT